MKSKLLTYLMIILEIFIIGALIVLFKLNIKIEYWYSYFLLYVVAFLVSIYLNVIFHELGHLMMGLLTGYQFVSFYALGHIWYRDTDGKIKHQKSKQPGILGQALMKYPKEFHKDMPYFWYNFGGIFVNIVTVIIEVIILAFNIHPIVNIVLLIFLYITLLMLFSNGIPYKDSFNDARNIVSIKKSKRNLKACYDQLEVAYHLINTPIEELQIDDYLNDDLSVGMVAGNNIFNFYKALASKDAEGAFHIISTLYNKIDQIITPMQALVYSEYLTMVLLYERDLTKVTKIFNEMKKPIRNAILLVKDSPFLRGAIIYYRFVKHDEKRIPKLYDAAYLTIKKSNQKGLNDTLLMLLDEVINYQEGEINE